MAMRRLAASGAEAVARVPVHQMARIESPEAIRRILTHLGLPTTLPRPALCLQATTLIAKVFCDQKKQVPWKVQPSPVSPEETGIPTIDARELADQDAASGGCIR